MPDNQPTPRWQFSLWTAFVAVTLFAVYLAAAFNYPIVLVFSTAIVSPFLFVVMMALVANRSSTASSATKWTLIMAIVIGVILVILATIRLG